MFSQKEESEKTLNKKKNDNIFRSKARGDILLACQR